MLGAIIVFALILLFVFYPENVKCFKNAHFPESGSADVMWSVNTEGKCVRSGTN